MKNLILLFLATAFIILSSNKGYCQFPPNALFLDRTSIDKYHIDDIREICKFETDSPTDSNYTVYHFGNGLVTGRSTVSGGMEGDGAFAYNRKDRLERIDSRDDVSARQSDLQSYRYLDGKIRLTLNGVSYWSMKTSGALIRGITKWFYYPDGRLKCLVEYGFDEVEERDISTGKISRLIRFPESVHQTLSPSMPLAEVSKQYFVYYRNNIVGSYTRERYTADGTLVNSLGFKKNVNALKKLGFKGFSEKYHNKAVYEKVIQDCYSEVKDNELLINDKPAKKFLSEIGKSDTQYIILKIADANFSFYKLIQ